MKKLIRWVDVNFEAILMVIFFSMMILLVTVQVFLRFVLKSGFSWGEEVARILFVWMSFSSFGYLTRNSRHVRVGFLTGKLPEKVQKSVLLVCDVLFLVFTAYGLKAVVSLCMDAAKYHDKLTAVPWNYNVLYLAGALGFFMMVIRNIQVIVWKLRNWKAPLERFINYDGLFYESNKICFEPEVKDILEELEAGTEEKIGLGE